jgi:hypothetical protein
MVKNKTECRETKCPECGSSAVRYIVYGRLLIRDASSFDQSKYVLGGCIVQPENHVCDECKHRWRA